MIKVKEWLDDNISGGKTDSIRQKPNGHWEVQGSWSWQDTPKWTAPVGGPFDKDGYMLPVSKLNNAIRCNINNETLRIDIIVNGEWTGWYGYLQTYEHIPRGEPDIHGYYKRSTPEEIIRYISECWPPIKQKVRDKKLEELLK